MKSRKWATLFTFLLLFSGCATAASQTQPQLPRHRRPDGFWTNEKAAVQVLHVFSKNVTDSQGNTTMQLAMMLGTAAVWDVNGLVLTNYHVVAKHPLEAIPNQPVGPSAPPEIFMVCTVTDDTRDCNPAEVVATDPENDLAFLRTDMYFDRAVEWVADSTLQRADEIYFWGNVFSFLPPSPFLGRYIGRVGPPYYSETDFRSPLPLLLMDINVSPGSSGSPVFNELGKCIGLASGYTPFAMGGRSLGIVIPSTTIMQFAKDNKALLYPKKK